jgi:hypothetical protein
VKKDIKYVVRLEPKERQVLLDLVTKGKRAASVLTRARVLLKADAGAAGPGCSDAVIAEAVGAYPACIASAKRLSKRGWKRRCIASDPRAGNIAN